MTSLQNDAVKENGDVGKRSESPPRSSRRLEIEFPLEHHHCNIMYKYVKLKTSRKAIPSLEINATSKHPFV